jgi:hypothetical protein
MGLFAEAGPLQIFVSNHVSSKWKADISTEKMSDRTWSSLEVLFYSLWGKESSQVLEIVPQ